MSKPDTTPTPADVLQLLRKHPVRWLAPAVIVAMLAAVFTAVWPRSWVATQGLIVRNEATDVQLGTPGNFRMDNELKVTLETILEIARSRGVLEAALKEVGPPADYRQKGNKPFPTAEDFADLRMAVKLTPPKGVEFGTTEVFYLEVKNQDRSRALALTTIICDHLEQRLQEIREHKAENMTAELDKTVAIAEQDLAESTVSLKTIEAKAGSDLIELRILHRSAADTSDLRRTLVQVASELRQNEVKRLDNEELLKLLQSGAADSEHLLAVPNTLLVSQPALKRLKDGLIDAQIKASNLQGRFTDAHPQVKAALNSVKMIEQHMRNEIEVAIRGIETGLRMADSRTALLQKQLDNMQARIDRLVALRVDYSNLVADVEHRTTLLGQARTKLMNARADRVGADTGSLLSRIDTPNTGTKPAGPGHAMVVLAGFVGGLIMGLGLLVLTVSSAQPAPAPVPTRRNAVVASETNSRNEQHVPSLVEQAL